MGKITNLRQTIIEANAALRSMIAKLADEINGLPDNPKAVRISSNIVIVNSRDLLSENWTAEFYNFRWQYTAICLYMTSENVSPEAILKRVESIIETGKIPYPTLLLDPAEFDFHRLKRGNTLTWSTHLKQALHPDVISNLKHLFQEAG